MATPRKVGVLTFHKSINYGSYWQARCLTEGLRGLGHDAELLDYHCNCVTRAEAKCALQPRLPHRASRPEMRGYSAKVRKFIDAISALPLSRQFSLHDPDGAPEFDRIVVGSDEVWNLSHPWYGGKPLFYGVGLKPPRLISYAASFGSYSCHWGIQAYWADQLRRFDSLSVRDDNSYWLVRGSTGSEPPLVLDPCLQFADSIPDERGEDVAPYLLVYGHGFPDWLARSARAWAASAGIRIVSIGYRNDFADEQMIGAGPIEFARMMAGAKAVITNFFHGCVFALRNARPFAATVSEYRYNKVQDLASALGVRQRIIDGSTRPQELQRLLSTPPTPRVASRIAELRQRSREFLDEALC